jgi:hypothetical protein
MYDHVSPGCRQRLMAAPSPDACQHQLQHRDVCVHQHHMRGDLTKVCWGVAYITALMKLPTLQLRADCMLCWWCCCWVYCVCQLIRAAGLLQDTCETLWAVPCQCAGQVGSGKEADSGLGLAMPAMYNQSMLVPTWTTVWHWVDLFCMLVLAALCIVCMLCHWLVCVWHMPCQQWRPRESRV